MYENLSTSLIILSFQVISPQEWKQKTRTW